MAYIVSEANNTNFKWEYFETGLPFKNSNTQPWVNFPGSYKKM